MATTETDIAPVAADLRVVLGRLIRRLRAENTFPLSHGLVLGRLDRDGPKSVSDLAAGERMRPQSMAQTVGDGRRALVSLTPTGLEKLEENRRNREGWLFDAIAELPDVDRETLERAVVLLNRLADSDV